MIKTASNHGKAANARQRQQRKIKRDFYLRKTQYDHYAAQLAQCPYYIGETLYNIHCERLPEMEGKRGAVILHFGKEDQRNVYQEIYCRSVECWPQCPIAAAITAQIEAQEREGKSRSD